MSFKIIISFILICIGIASLFYIYQYLPGEQIPLKVSNYFYKIPVADEFTKSEISQFYPFMRFNHNSISYYFTQDCSSRRVEKMKEAFSIIQEETENIFFFQGDNNSDIVISCSEEAMKKEKNLFIAGEGGPTEIINSSIYPVILKGSIFLYQSSSCDYPVVELHELLHVFGFEHINNTDLLMYPYFDCLQVLGEDYPAYLKKLYEVKPMADLYFENTNVSKAGIYLDFDVVVTNGGMIDTSNVNLSVYANNKQVDSFDLGNISFGSSKIFYVKNLLLPSRSTSEIVFMIEAKSEEYDKQNNVLRASVS